MFVQRQPMGRVADAAEIAPIVVYLAADEAAFTTGTVMMVDGGSSRSDGFTSDDSRKPQRRDRRR